MPRTYTYIESFRLNNSEIERIATSSKTAAAVRDIAVKAAVYARGITPDEVGHVYKQSFRIRMHIRNDWPHNSPHRSSRICADLANVAPYAIVVEVGHKATGRTDAHRILGKTLQSMRIKGKARRRRAR